MTEVENYLKTIFTTLYLRGDITIELFSSIRKILLETQIEPISKIKEWEKSAQELVKTEFNVDDVRFLAISHDFIEHKDLEYSLNLLWRTSLRIEDSQLMASTRLIMIQFWGEGKQRELISKWKQPTNESNNNFVTENNAEKKKDLSTTIRNLVAKDDLNQAFNVLINDERCTNNTRLLNDITLLRQQYNVIQREILIDIGRPRTDANRVARSILEITSMIENESL